MIAASRKSLALPAVAGLLLGSVSLTKLVVAVAALGLDMEVYHVVRTIELYPKLAAIPPIVGPMH